MRHEQSRGARFQGLGVCPWVTEVHSTPWIPKRLGRMVQEDTSLSHLGTFPSPGSWAPFSGPGWELSCVETAQTEGTTSQAQGEGLPSWQPQLHRPLSYPSRHLHLQNLTFRHSISSSYHLTLLPLDSLPLTLNARANA